MKYTLVVGIEYRKYKRPANIRVSADDRLIDEFELDEDTKSFESADQVLNNINKVHYKHSACDTEKSHSRKVIRGAPMDRIYQGPMDPRYIDTMWPSNTVPRYFKVYDIDDTQLKNILKLTISNSNNDYSNGFMKNSSLIRFPIIALFPKKLTENNCEELMKILFRFESSRRDSNWNINKDDEKKIPSGCRWPFPEYYKLTFNDKHNAGGIKGQGNWIGGSFELELKIKKKHRVSFLCPEGLSTTGLWSNTNNAKAYTVASCKQLLNIYNEDQRSNSTKD